MASNGAVAGKGGAVAAGLVPGRQHDAVAGQQPDWAAQQRTAAVDDWDLTGWFAAGAGWDPRA